MITIEVPYRRMGIPPDTCKTRFFVCLFLLKSIDIFLISAQKHAVGTHQKCFIEVLLMSTHNICF